MALVVAPAYENAPARCGAALATAADLAATKAVERRLGMVAETYRQGKASTLLRCARGLIGAGAAIAAVAGGRSRPAAMAGGLALLAGSACTRLGVFAAGIASADDPVYTVVPQREAKARREAAGA